VANKINFSTPFLHVEGNIAWANNGDILKCYTVELPEIYASSESEFDAMYDLWYKALKNLNPGTIFFKQDVYLKDRFDSRSLPDGNYFQKATRRHFNGREYMNHQCYVYFIYTKNSVLKNGSIRNPFKSLPKEKVVRENLKEIDELFHRETDNLVEFINTSRKISMRPMDEKQIRNHAQNYFNGFYTDRLTDTEKKEKYYQVGDRRCGAFVIKGLKQFQVEQMPNVVVDSRMSTTDYKFYRGYSDNLGLTLNCDHVYNQIFFIEDHHTIKADIKKNQSNLFGSRGFGADNKVGAIALEEYLEKEVALDEKIKFIRAHYNVIFFADNDTEFKLYDGQLSSVFKDMDIRPYYPNGNNLANIVNNSHPAHISFLDLDNTFTIDLQMAICMIANVTNYKNDDEGILFNDRLTNLPIRKDVWDARKKRIKARNFFVMAPTGEGKSFLIEHIARMLLESDVIFVINDLGDSYIKLCLLFPELHLYIKYKHGEPLGINPLYLAPGEKLPINQLNSILSFIALLWKRDNALSTEQEVSLRKIIEAYYENVPKNHSFPSFYQFVQRNQASLLQQLDISDFYFPIDEFLHNCSEFIGDGAYGFLFRETKQTSHDLTGKRLVVFEYDEAKEDPLLLSILLMMSSEITRKLCWLDKTQRGIVLFEEFAKFLKYPNVLNSVQFYYQAARKQECAIGTVLQSPSQLPENDTANGIIDNTQVLYVLPNNKGYKAVVDRFKMSSHANNQMMSMSSNFSGKRKYSEFYLDLGGQGNVMRLEVPPEVYCAYLTEGAEHEKIMALYQQKGRNMEAAIQQYLENQKQPQTEAA
jgi:conjugal transfer ATP-binding protein TraC